VVRHSLCHAKTPTSDGHVVAHGGGAAVHCDVLPVLALVREPILMPVHVVIGTQAVICQNVGAISAPTSAPGSAISAHITGDVGVVVGSQTVNRHDVGAISAQLSAPGTGIAGHFTLRGCCQ